MAKEPANDAVEPDLAVAGELERCQEIHDDIVVISGVESDVVAARFDNSPDHIERLVSIEWSDLNGNEILDFRELPPECIGQRPAAGGGLQIEADDGDDFSDGAAMSQQLAVGGLRQCTQA